MNQGNGKGQHPSQKRNNNVDIKRKPRRLEAIFSNPKAISKASVDMIEASCHEYTAQIFEDYIKFKRGEIKRPDWLFNMFKDISFASILKSLMKEKLTIFENYREEFSELLGSAIHELRMMKTGKSDFIINIYLKIYEDWNEVRIERILNVYDETILGDKWGWDLAVDIALASHGSPTRTMSNTLRLIYNYVDSTKHKVLRKLLKTIYKTDDMGYVAIGILIDRPFNTKQRWMRKEQFDVFTDIALETLMKKKKSEIEHFLKRFCEERKRMDQGFQIPEVRLSLINLDKYRYGKIRKIAKRLSKKNKMRRYYLQ